MAFGRLERRKADAPISDINMTPLIDVMLVLLVIFIITAPLMVSAVKVDLPKAESAKADGVLYWDEQPVDAAAFTQRLAQFQTRGGERPEVMLRADQAVPYGRVAALIGQLQQAGLSRIAFITETPSTWAGDR